MVVSRSVLCVLEKKLLVALGSLGLTCSSRLVYTLTQASVS